MTVAGLYNKTLDEKKQKTPLLQDANVYNVEKKTKKPIAMHFVFFMLLVNLIFSVGIVFTNKQLYKKYKFPPVTLACVHFGVTFIGLCICALVGELKVKMVPIYKVIPISAAFCSFVVFTNLSLKYNSIGTYQILKCLGDPLLIILQSYFYGKVYSNKIKVTLLVMVSGIVVNSVFDVGYNFLGISYGLVAVVGATLYYMWIETKQQELKLKPMQLLFFQAPISSAMLAIIVCYTEAPWARRSVFRRLNTEGLLLMLLSSIMACAVNVSVFFIIRHTSVITYAVFSKVKTCVVILGGSLIALNPNVLLTNQMAGISLTLLGTAMYTVFKLAEYDKDRRPTALEARFSNLNCLSSEQKPSQDKLSKIYLL